MSRWVVDASIAVKWFLAEPHGEAAQRLLTGQRELLAPDLLPPELGNVLWKKVRRAEILRGQAEMILGLFRQAPVTIYPSWPMLDLALRIALESGCSVYDGLYVSLSVLEHCVLATADRKLLTAFRRRPFGANLLWVEEIV